MQGDVAYQLLLEARNLDRPREDVGDKVHLVGVSDLVWVFTSGGIPERRRLVSKAVIADDVYWMRQRQMIVKGEKHLLIQENTVNIGSCRLR